MKARTNKEPDKYTDIQTYKKTERIYDRQKKREEVYDEKLFFK